MPKAIFRDPANTYTAPVETDRKVCEPLTPDELKTEQAKDPRFYRSRLAQCVEYVGTKLIGWDSHPGCRYIVGLLGFGDIEQLVEASKLEEKQSLGPRFSDAEKAVADAESKATEARATLEAERANAARRDEVGALLGRLRGELSRMPSEQSMQAKIDAAIQTLATGWCQNLLATHSQAPEDALAVALLRVRLEALPFARKKLQGHISELEAELATLQPAAKKR